RNQLKGKNNFIIDTNKIAGNALKARLEERCKINAYNIEIDGIDRSNKEIENSINNHLDKHTDYDAIIISYNDLAKFNSIEFANKLRKKKAFQHIPFILTISPFDKTKIDRKKTQIFNHLVSKPTKTSKLDEALFKIFNLSNDNENKTDLIESADSVNSDLGKNVKILICEDNEINIKVIENLLKRLGCITEVAENGSEAINKFLHVKYDLILMDCMMPIMDGFKATKKIRLIEKEKKVKKPTPIIALTANITESDRQTSLNAGMDDFISKPIKREAIEAIIKTWVLKQEPK
ncbi:MAG: response regulator, partial [Proteobacteria bacterium]|nr:response regulator [Pseudomonadota bacterium]